MFLKSDGRYDEVYLRNYILLNVRDELNRVEGVGQVYLFGGGDYAMRVWLDPEKTAARGISAGDVVRALREQNVQVSAGSIGAPPQPGGSDLQVAINAQGRLSTVEEFAATWLEHGRAKRHKPSTMHNKAVLLRCHLLPLLGKLRLNANAFLTDWRNQQVSVNFGLNSFDINTVNAARSRLYGFEVEAVEQLSDEWSLYASIGHTHTRFSRFTLPLTGTAANLKGTEFAHAPHWTLSGGADFQLHNNLFGSLNASYSSRSFAAVGPSQYLYRVVPHTIVNGRIGYRTERWSVAVEVQNLLDKVYAVYKSPTESRAVLNAPRTFGAEFSVHF